MTPETTAVLYRVSTDDQDHDSQRKPVEDWLRAHGVDPAKVVVYLETETGTRVDRRGLRQLNKDIFAGRIKTVVVYKVDRLARNLKEGVALLGDWTERGIRFVSATQPIDLSGAVGRMMAAVLLGLGEIEWEFRRERQRDGIAAAKKAGVYKGRKPGTNKKPPARFRELREKGLTGPEIATALGVSVRTVRRYAGTAS